MPPKRPTPSDETPCRLILVVDDNDEVRGLIERVMVGRGWPCISVESAAQALQVLQAREVAVLITDQRMPGVTGVELLRLVRRDYPRTRCVMVTGAESGENVAQVARLGAVMHLKPFDPYGLGQLIDHELELYRLAEPEAPKANGSNGHG